MQPSLSLYMYREYFWDLILFGQFSARLCHTCSFESIVKFCLSFLPSPSLFICLPYANLSSFFALCIDDTLWPYEYDYYYYCTKDVHLAGLAAHVKHVDHMIIYEHVMSLHCALPSACPFFTPQKYFATGSRNAVPFVDLFVYEVILDAIFEQW